MDIGVDSEEGGKGKTKRSYDERLIHWQRDIDDVYN